MSSGRFHSAPGSRVADYVVIDEIARGGQGVVLKARHHQMGALVALKLLHELNDESRARFLREAKTLAALKHPGIVGVLNCGILPDGVAFLAMEFVEGVDLSTLVRGQGPPSPQRTAEILAQVADALHYCHTRGIVHRDLKPGNVLVERGSGQARLVDFGMTKQLSRADREAATLTEDGQILGTPAYMSPEQADSDRGAIGPHTDIYALGAVLHFLLTGKAPFSGAALYNIIFKVLQAPAPDPREENPAADKGLSELCLACLVKEPEKRPLSAGEVAQRLRQCVTPERGRGSPLWPVAVMVAGLAIAASIVLTKEPPPGEAPSSADAAASPVVAARLDPPPSATQPASAVPRPVAATDAFARGQACEDSGEWQEAIEAYSEAIRLAPDYPRALARRGFCRWSLGDPAAAVEDYTRAIRLEPEDARHYFNRAVNRSELGDHEGATADYSTSIRLDPGLGKAYGERGRLRWKHGDSRAAIADFTEAIRLDPDHAGLHYYNRAFNYAELGDHRSAVSDYTQSLHLVPDDADAYEKRGDARFELGDVDGSIEDYSQAIRLDPRASAYASRGYSHWTRDQLQAAIKDYTQAMELDPTDSMHPLNRGYNRAQQGDYAGAVEDFERVLELNPQADVPLEEYRQKLAAQQGEAR
jgi:tetratricopeptide (TPR) repeat protein/tRNA A-37 threonylcarbamoyl transferase component Bud32